MSEEKELQKNIKTASNLWKEAIAQEQFYNKLMKSCINDYSCFTRKKSVLKKYGIKRGGK